MTALSHENKFLVCDSMLSVVYAIANPSVCLSVTRVDQSKTVKLGSCSFDHTVVDSSLWFLARDSMLSALYAIARPSVRPSVTRVDQSKTVERIIEILSPSDRHNILVFRHQRSLRKSDGFTPNGGAKYKGGSKN